MMAQNPCGSLRKSASATSAKNAQVIEIACGTGLRKSAEVCGTDLKKANEINAEVCGSVAELDPPLKRATSAPPSSRVGRADLIAPIHTSSIPAMRKMAGRS